jgi:hypothetical protein
MKERSLTRLIVLSVSLILPSVLVPINLCSLSQSHFRSTLVADGVPLPPPEPLPPPPPPHITSASTDGVPLPPPEPLPPPPPPKVTGSTTYDAKPPA